VVYFAALPYLLIGFVFLCRELVEARLGFTRVRVAMRKKVIDEVYHV